MFNAFFDAPPTAAPPADGLYGADIRALADAAEDFGFLLLPDVSVDASGTACGDVVQVDLAVDGGRLRVAIRVVGCELCRASATDLRYALRDATPAEARTVGLTRLRALLEGGPTAALPAGLAQWANVGRNTCLALPNEALLHALAQFETPDGMACEWNGPVGMSCDACVTGRKVNWAVPGEARPEPKRGVVARVKRVLGNAPARPADCPVSLARFGRLVYSDRERGELAVFIREVNPRQIEYLRRVHALGLMRNHAVAAGAGELHPELASAIRRASLHNRAMLREGNRILDRCRAAAIPVTPVKGLFTSGLYPHTGLRHFKDLDFVTPDFARALALASDLLFRDGYAFTSVEGVPFSLKVAHDQDGEVLTGHFHIERSSGDSALVVDVNFPGIPVGRNASLRYPATGPDAPTASENQLVVTLAHLLKHHVTPVKDLNDLFLMLDGEMQLDPSRVLKMLRRHGLLFRARLAITFLQRTYGLGNTVASRVLAGAPLWERALIRWVLARRWPYEYRPHSVAQLYDEFYRESALHGIRAAARGIGQSGSGALNGDVSAVTRALGMPFGSRLYLVPAILFPVEIGSAVDWPATSAALGGDAQPVDPACAWMISRVNVQALATTVGLFVPTRDWRMTPDRGSLTALLLDVLRVSGIPQDAVTVVRVGAS